MTQSLNWYILASAFWRKNAVPTVDLIYCFAQFVLRFNSAEKLLTVSLHEWSHLSNCVYMQMYVRKHISCLSVYLFPTVYLYWVCITVLVAPFCRKTRLPAHLVSCCCVFPAIHYLVLDEAQQNLAMVEGHSVDGILSTYKTIIV